MDNHWSDYIQTTEELYASRDSRFSDANKDIWISCIGIKPGMKVLEVGCAGGTFCHKLKKYIPDLDITGLDFDKNHIAFAREKAKELGLECTFTEGDIGKMYLKNMRWENMRWRSTSIPAHWLGMDFEMWMYSFLRLWITRRTARLYPMRRRYVRSKITV